MTGATLTDLVGRRPELDAVDRLLDRARSAQSGVVVVRGEAGIGKTALLLHARERAASTFRVEQVIGVESETQLAFAGLHQLCGPLLPRTSSLPGPQRDALGVALGTISGTAPDRFLVGLATLNLLAEVSEDGPLLCLVDDAQWLDEASAQTLAFVARRLGAERIALVIAARDSAETDSLSFAGLPEIRLGGLDDAAARALLLTAHGTPVDDGVRERILAEARGNPLALLELPLNAPPSQLAGGYELPEGLSIPRRIEDGFRRRSESLPAPTQLLLLVAASEPTGDPALLWRAAQHLDIDRGAAAPAVAAGLLELDTRVRFRHPLVRSAVYQAAAPNQRRRAHGAIAAATDRDVDPDRRAWHRAQSVLGTDERAAAELERLAGRARARGGVAAAGAFLRQATELTPGRAERARRALDAAEAKHDAGAFDDALELLTVAAAAPLDAGQRARHQLLRARIAFHLTRGKEVPDLLLQAAETLTPLAPGLARETYLQALDAAATLGGCDVREVAASTRGAPAAPTPARPVDLLLDAMVSMVTDGYEAGAAAMRTALEGFRDTGSAVGDDDGRHWLWLAGRMALALYDSELVAELGDRNIRLARESGTLALLPTALLFRSATLIASGELARAAELAAEGATITQVVGAAPLQQADLLLAAWRGDEDVTRAMTAASVAAHGEGGAEDALGSYALAVLGNGRGSYEEALQAALRVVGSDELPLAGLALPEAVEAAVRSDQPRLAASATEQLDARARAAGTPWAFGLAARSRALIGQGSAAEEAYREAIALLQTCGMRNHLSRTHLVYGEWLRREGRRQDAREQLRTAHEMLTDMGATAFTARATSELRATGERPRRRTVSAVDELTAQEVHIARLVATGATSREIGEQLFLSPRTIEAHLRNIFRKLGISSRRQLRSVPLP